MNKQNDKFESYNKQKKAVIDVIDASIASIAEPETLRTLKKKRTQLDGNRFVVSVFGHFSNGKSTFLNALMGFGEEILVEDDAASTATITRLKYADMDDEKLNNADIIFRDGRTEHVGISDIKDYVARNSDREVERDIAEVVLYLNSEFLKNGVEIVDTPGFNSTYRLHTEIALRQVEESDAAIFMFTCEKTGSDQEFNFLNKIQRYMNRVFFVMNKYDKSNTSGDDEIADLNRKFREKGINIGNKPIYPISARMARDAIAENDKAKLERSHLPLFEAELTDYLLSEESVTDRLLAPLNSVKGKLKESADSLSERIEICSKDESEVKKEIEKRRSSIKDSENELNKKKKNIREGVRSEISQIRNNVQTAVNKVFSKQEERLSSVNSRFDISMVAFEDFELETYLMFKDKWDEISENLEKKLMDVLSTNIDDEEYYNSIELKIRRIIRSDLVLEKISVKQPGFDFSQLAEFDKAIETARAEYKKVYEKGTDLYGKKEERDQIYQAIEEKKKNYERERSKKEKRIDVLSTVQIDYIKEPEKYYEEVERNRILQFFLGSKKVERTRFKDVTDDRAKKAADAEIRQIESALEKSRLKAYADVEELKNRLDMMKLRGIEREIRLQEVDEEQKRDELREAQKRAREQKYIKEKQIIQVEKKKFLNEIESALRDMGRNINNFLDNNRKNYISILTTALDDETNRIEEEKDNIEKMVRINDKTPEEIQKELETLVEQRKTINGCIEEIATVCEGLEG